MKRGMNKRGQFFIIAAIIIVTVIISIVTVSNYTQPKQTVKLYDLGKELGIESRQVLDYGTYSQLNETAMKNLMENFIKNYINYIGPDRNVYFIFGNSNKIYVIGYQQLANESVCIKLNPIDSICGNGIIEKGEECDNGAALGTNGCSTNCKIQSPGCQITTGINNETNSSELITINPGEFCHADNLNGYTCASFGFTEPTTIAEGATALQCNSECGFDASNCVMPPKNETECQPLTVLGQTQEFPKASETISKVSIKMGDNEYEFNLKPGENFYFVIWEKIGGERNVVTSEQ